MSRNDCAGTKDLPRGRGGNYGGARRPDGRQSMDAAYLSALSALAGSAVGGLTMALSAWISQSVSARAGLISSHLARRQELFRDFIVSASRVYGEALTSSEPKIPELLELYALISRMRVLCRPETVAAGENLMRSILDTYLAPNRTFKELRDLMTAGDGIDPLKEFSVAAREEIEAARASRF